MKITNVRYERIISLPNFENERIAAEALVEDGECPDYVLNELTIN